MVAVFMISAKLATLGLLKKVFKINCQNVIIFAHDVNDKILSRDSNHLVDVIM